jgi:hypothetical protein
MGFEVWQKGSKLSMLSNDASGQRRRCYWEGRDAHLNKTLKIGSEGQEDHMADLAHTCVSLTL